LIYILVALVARKNAKINPGLCANHRKRRYLAIGLGWTGIILGALFAVVGGINDIPAFLLFGIVFLLGSSIAGLIFARIVFPKKIDKEFVFLKGCGNDFLDSLPDFKA
jgi:dolichol kinase